VLARIEGAPEGVKGISLFIVPKFMSTPTARPARATACLRLDRAQDGHSRQFDLRDEL
jgi:alkylation response protein AidB-like acyl-CoA dehydrogenase